jgi:hypothetical protein
MSKNNFAFTNRGQLMVVAVKFLGMCIKAQIDLALFPIQFQ